MTRLEMIQRAMHNFMEPTDRRSPSLISSFYDLDSLGGGLSSIMLLQALLSEQEYEELAVRLRAITGRQGMLPHYGDWMPDEVEHDIQLSTVYEELVPILSRPPVSV